MKSRQHMFERGDNETIHDRMQEKKQYAQHMERDHQRKQTKTHQEHQQTKAQDRYQRSVSFFCDNQLKQPRSHSEERNQEIIPRQRY